MAENENVVYDENEGTVTLNDDEGNDAVFHFYDETYIPLDDEDGVTTNFECISSMEYKGAVYYALLPEAADDEEPDCGMCDNQDCEHYCDRCGPTYWWLHYERTERDSENE